MWGVNQSAWLLFTDCATRSTVTLEDKRERDLFDIDIAVAKELMVIRDLDPDDFEKLIQLRKGLNA